MKRNSSSVYSEPVSNTGQALDPTENVKNILFEAVKRIDDLREAETRRINERLNTEVTHARELSVAEAKRIDAIRIVDVNAVAVANERAIAQASVLASQVASSAETLRALVAATAATVAQQLSQLSAQLSDRLSSLERAQYESKGKSGISTPIIAIIATFVGGIVVYLIEHALVK
jgi:3-oxoacyl-ACP reductase-like protein